MSAYGALEKEVIVDKKIRKIQKKEAIHARVLMQRIPSRLVQLVEKVLF